MEGSNCCQPHARTCYRYDYCFCCSVTIGEECSTAKRKLAPPIARVCFETPRLSHPFQPRNKTQTQIAGRTGQRHQQLPFCHNDNDKQVHRQPVFLLDHNDCLHTVPFFGPLLYPFGSPFRHSDGKSPPAKSGLTFSVTGRPHGAAGWITLYCRPYRTT